jgi:hypothetical protein
VCSGDHEVRCVQRKLLLEALSNELPSGTIRFSSKVVTVEESGFYKLVHLADGTILKTKVNSPCFLLLVLCYSNGQPKFNWVTYLNKLINRSWIMTLLLYLYYK